MLTGPAKTRIKLFYRALHYLDLLLAELIPVAVVVQCFAQLVRLQQLQVVFHHGVVVFKGIALK